MSSAEYWIDKDLYAGKQPTSQVLIDIVQDIIAVVVGQLLMFCLFCLVFFEICKRKSYFGLTDRTVL